MIRKSWKFFVLAAVLTLLLTGCDSQLLFRAIFGAGEEDAVTQPPPTLIKLGSPTPNVTNTPILEPLVTATPSFTPAFTPTPSLTPTPPYDAAVDVQLLNVRYGPDTVYDVIDKIPEGTALNISGRDTSYEWVQVYYGQGKAGWVYVPMLKLNIDLGLVPLVPIPPTPTPLATPTPEMTINFWADAATINAGECTYLNWQVTNVQAVYLDGQGVIGSDRRQVCPPKTTTYTLSVRDNQGQTVLRQVTIDVIGPYVRFYADATTINSGDCTTLHWETENVKAVYFEGSGTTGNNSQQVCPGATKTYTLKVVFNDDSEANYNVTITVN